MIGATNTRGKMLTAVAGALCLLAGAAGCNDRDPNRIQGYVEGEFVYVASPLGGTLEYLHVQRGTQVKAGDPLFALENTPETAARDEAERRLAAARANLADARKPKRPSEIESLEAQLRQAKVSLAYSERNLARQENVPPSATSEEELDRARTAYNQDRQRIAQLEADLQTALLGARPDQIEAAEANVRALEAVLAKAEWDLAQKHQNATQEGLVFDTLFRPGEWVAAGRPVVVLLPPQNIKVRAFIPEPRIGTVKLGQQASVHVDGVAAPYVGTVSFISPRAEYTPPVIYSRESRAKLVFMIEVVVDPEAAVNLHPGQPVDVQLVD